MLINCNSNSYNTCAGICPGSTDPIPLGLDEFAYLPGGEGPPVDEICRYLYNIRSIGQDSRIAVVEFQAFQARNGLTKKNKWQLVFDKKANPHQIKNEGDYVEIIHNG